jgi:hypothetical protein
MDKEESATIEDNLSCIGNKPEAISVLDKHLLGEEMRKRSMGRFRERYADMLINIAKDTVVISEGVSGLSMDIRHILIQLEMLKTLLPR